MPEPADVKEKLEVSDQAVRDQDTQRKQSNKDYDLLEKKKENKTPCYENEPYEVMSRYGDQVVLWSPQGVQYQRNLQHIKPFNIPDQKEQETPL